MMSDHVNSSFHLSVMHHLNNRDASGLLMSAMSWAKDSPKMVFLLMGEPDVKLGSKFRPGSVASCGIRAAVRMVGAKSIVLHSSFRLAGFILVGHENISGVRMPPS